MASTVIRPGPIVRVLLLLFLLLGAGCAVGSSNSAVGTPEQTSTQSQAAGACGALTPSQSLQLQVLTAACAGNQVQDFFQVTNTGTSAVKLSEIAIKFWIDDTTGQAAVPHVWNGGCVTGANGNPSCAHPAVSVTAASTQFAACGPDLAHQANWEITITSADDFPLQPGETWGDIQSEVNLANWASFSPGTADWFSPCLNAGASFAADPRFAVYVGGNLVFANGINAPDCRAPHGSQTLSSYVLPPASPVTGAVPPDTVIPLAISLPLRDPDGLQAFIHAVSNPASPKYRQYLTIPAFTATYGPLPRDYSQLVGWAQGLGLTVQTYPNNVLVDVSGTAAQLEQALFVNFVQGTRPDGSTFYRPDRAPTPCLPVAPDGIDGLDDYAVPTPLALTGTAPDGSLTGSDLRSAYLGPFGDTPACNSLLGTGQSVGLVEFDGFFPADIARYEFDVGLNVPIPNAILVNNITTAAPSGISYVNGPARVLGEQEVALDIEVAMGMAPGATVVPVEGKFLSSILERFATLVSAAGNPTVNQISDSWGFGGTNLLKYAQELAAQGQSLFVASGDQGAYQINPPVQSCSCACTPPLADGGQPPLGTPTIDGGTFTTCPGNTCMGPEQCPPSTALCGTLGALPPQVTGTVDGVRSLPNITLVGGTNLFTQTVSGTPQTWSSESGWKGSGGGVLTGVPIQDFQELPGLASQLLSATNRSAPDVAMPAVNVYSVSSTCITLTNNVCQTYQQAGFAAGATGTSVSAPLWAAFTALLNEAGSDAGVRPVGFMNEALYTIATGPQYAQAFHDIQDASGNKNACGSSYGAAPGWDPVTGLGSPTCGLIAAVDQLAQPPEVTVTLSGLDFETTGFNLLNCVTPEDTPTSTPFYPILDANGNLIITCQPRFLPDGSISRDPVTAVLGNQREVSCAGNNGMGADITITCQGHGMPGDIGIDVKVKFGIEANCGDGFDEASQTVSLADVVPGLPVTGSPFPGACQMGFNPCGGGNPCAFNSFQGNVSASNSGGF